jgi:hypothetical protein
VLDQNILTNQILLSKSGYKERSLAVKEKVKREEYSSKIELLYLNVQHTNEWQKKREAQSEKCDKLCAAH